MKSLLRKRDQHDSGKVAMVELFFDLVFVFAITQLSHALLADLTLAGAAKAAFLTTALWWGWIYTSWVTNWLDPERLPVRLMLFALMLVGLIISAAIPKAFADRGAAFAIAFVLLQVGRTLFMLWAIRGETRGLVRNFQRILIWFTLSSVFWIVGALSEADARIAWWCAALATEFISPIVYMWVPGLGRSATSDWNVDANHIAERCALFVIIALGESILVTGATFAGLAWNGVTASGFAVGVLGSIALWWIYFDTGAGRAHHRMLKSSDPGSHARAAYTYLHLPIIAGIIVCAVADELVLAHPDHLTAAGTATILGGPALYLIGTAGFKWVMNDRKLPPLSHVVGLVLLALLLPVALAHLVSALVLSALTTVTLVVVAAWESLAVRSARPERKQ
jgi:low temperature requirement protein LtrA